MMFLSILPFVGDFAIAIFFLFISFYLPAWWHPYCKTIIFWIEAKKLDVFTFNTFTFSYLIFLARVNHFQIYERFMQRLGCQNIKLWSASPGNKPLNAVGSLSCSPGSVQWKLVQNHKHGKLILKTENIYIEIYLSIYIFVLFFCLVLHCRFIIF